jgi:hypothetical protein
MSNLPIKNNSKLLYLQARYQFEQAKMKFEDGSIKSEPRLIQTVFQAFQDFFVSAGKPMMIPRYAVDGGPPWSADFNSMMDEIKQDLDLLYQEVDITGRALFTDFNHNVVQQSMLQNEFEQIADKIKDLELLSSNLSSNGHIIFCRNDFANNDKIDFDRITGVPAHIENGAVTLKQKKSENKSEIATVAIVPGNKTYKAFIIGSESNGFPGNNHEITVTPGTNLTPSDRTYQFIGQKNNRCTYGAILDGNANSWFEYELVNVRDQDKQRVAKNLGWEYQVDGNQKLLFAREPEGGMLKLHLQIVLDEETLINSINVNMYTPPNHGAKTAVIKDILISDGAGAPSTIMTANKKSTDYTFHFTPRKAKVISVLFEQAEKYFTDIGHIYYEAKRQIENGPDYVFDTVNKVYSPNHLPRQDGPLIALQDLGVIIKTTQASVDATYAPQKAEAAIQSMENIINNVQYNLHTENIEMGIERFEGWRYCIGIRDIEIFSTEYEPTAQIVTEPYYFEQPLEKITLEVNEEMPQYLQYAVSIDDGATWHDISPIDRQVYVDLQRPEPPKIYTIQQVDKGSQRSNPRPGYLETETPVYSVRLRVNLTQPEALQSAGFLQLFADDPSLSFGTPILRSFNIKAYLQGEVQDSQMSSRKAFDPDAELPDDEIIDPPYFPPSPPAPTDPPPPPDPDKPPPTQPPVDDEVDIPDPDPRYPELRTRITNKATSFCHGDELAVSGIVDGPYPIAKAVLLIDGSPVQEKAGGSATELSYSFKIPTSGYSIDQSIAIEVKGFDTQGNVDTDSYTLLLKDCTIPPPPVKIRNCLQFDSLRVQYYQDDDRAMNTFDIPYDWLPYELDNGNGDKVTFGWEASKNGVVVMMTESFDSSGMTFNLSSIGIAYRDEYDKEQTSWAAGIAEQSAGVKNANLMLGAPDSKDSNSWITAVQSGNYMPAPAIGAQNDFIVFRFSGDWNSKHCPIGAEKNFDPDDHIVDRDLTSPPIKPYDPSQGPQRNCLAWEGVIVQYYEPKTDTLERVTVPIEDLGDKPVKMGSTWVMIGWSDYFKGVTVKMHQLNEGSGSYNGHITGVAIKFGDYYGDRKEAWSKEILFETAGVMNSQVMVGEPKEYSALSWIPEVKADDFTNAPSLMDVGDYVAFKFMDEFTNNHCPIDASKENDPELGIDPSNPPDQPHVYIEPFPWSSTPQEVCLMDAAGVPTMRVKGYAEDMKALKEVRFQFSNHLIDLSDKTIQANGQKRVDFDFTISLGDLPENTYRVTGWATNMKGISSPNVVTTPNKPFTDIRIINCQTNFTLDISDATPCNNAQFTLSGVAEHVKGIQSLVIMDQNGNERYRREGTAADTSWSYSANIPANLYPPGNMTFTATMTAINGRKYTRTITAVVEDCTPPPTINLYVNGTACSDKVIGFSMEVIGIGDVGTIQLRDQNGTVKYTGFGPSKSFNGTIAANSYGIGTTVTLTAKVTMVSGKTAEVSRNIMILDCSPGSGTTVYQCGVNSQSGGPGVTTNYHNMGPTPGLVRITYSMYGVPDQMDVYYKDVMVATTGAPVGNDGQLTFNYSPTGGIEYIKVVVTGPSGTSWSYKVFCPV